ncbi:hypothetical protein AtNW77_Chr1g0030441 [Arabidopsis thaliana]|uniref:Uncharacterized protein n=4 Tax=Arabidopsis TaxID=3701 RepID=A0A654EE98_ARATH|nr:uncharacterized protein AT1G27640 [Arabidopsis thaliana]KAG7647736.1 hypothetical protein ISN45_At01g027520 [Arabidopsis thaliana x Arabidopsis arenosa]KAG7655668.1 hypothetical protein ISN44_As01g027220 [Arabidopsis suecica]AAD46001.1 Contains similarity to gb/AF078070 heat-shock protein 90 from Griffithsia japonica. EST gb/T21496 comes from this gene [Arabidopsis thaliana]AAF24963.1 T22C5.9 [Arabidopsis thaliana]ABK32132.1 At1g27640 [Arabidopsis thaliana]|eukprot:NP_174085.1 hypothetical protein AT1G27640 [Arabidopsis thaliana]
MDIKSETEQYKRKAEIEKHTKEPNKHRDEAVLQNRAGRHRDRAVIDHKSEERERESVQNVTEMSGIERSEGEWSPPVEGITDEELPSHSPMDDLGFALFASWGRKTERQRMGSPDIRIYIFNPIKKIIIMETRIRFGLEWKPSGFGS